MRRTKEQIAADALAAAKIERQHNRVRELLASIKTAHHARNRGLVVQQLEQARSIAVALLEHQTGAALAAAKSSEPPDAEDTSTDAEANRERELELTSGHPS
jgi:hypothetical protein